MVKVMSRCKGVGSGAVQSGAMRWVFAVRFLPFLILSGGGPATCFVGVVKISIGKCKVVDIKDGISAEDVWDKKLEDVRVEEVTG